MNQIDRILNQKKKKKKEKTKQKEFVFTGTRSNDNDDGVSCSLEECRLRCCIVVDSRFEFVRLIERVSNRLC